MNKNKPKILMFSLDESLFLPEPGDTFYRFLEYVKYLNYLYVLVPTRPTEKKFIKYNNIKIYACSSNIKILRYFKLFVHGFFICLRYKPHIIVTNDTILGIIAYPFKVIFNIKLNITVFGTQIFEEEWRKRNLFANSLFKASIFVLKKSDSIRTGSMRVKKIIVDNFNIRNERLLYLPVIPSPKRIAILTNGENKRKKILGNKFDNLILSIGRLDENKNYEFLVDVAKRMLIKYPQLLFIIIGDGPNRNALIQKIRNYNLEDNIKLFGFVNDMTIATYLNTCDVFAHTSKSEGIPMVFIEAAICCKPIITTEVSGADEVIKNGKNGYIIRQNDIEDYCKKLTFILENKDIITKATSDIASYFNFNRNTLLLIESWYKLL